MVCLACLANLGLSRTNTGLFRPNTKFHKYKWKNTYPISILIPRTSCHNLSRFWIFPKTVMLPWGRLNGRTRLPTRYHAVHSPSKKISPPIPRGARDEDITPSDTTIDYKVSLFPHLHNDKSKNWLLPNMGILNVLRNNGDDDREWTCHEQHQSQSASSSMLSF